MDREAGMSAAYQHLALSQVKPGMILSDAILDKQGQVLLPHGAVLTAKTIALLPNHDIEMVAVLRAEGDLAAPTAPVDSGAIEARLERLFRKHQTGEADGYATHILQQYIRDFRLGQETAP
jgi:hypothetical protein